jgi:hypothetical protein
MNTASIMNLNTEVKMKYKCLNNNDRRFVSKAFYDREIKLLEYAKNEKKVSDHLPKTAEIGNQAKNLIRNIKKQTTIDHCVFRKRLLIEILTAQKTYCPHRGASRHLHCTSS